MKIGEPEQRERSSGCVTASGGRTGAACALGSGGCLALEMLAIAQEPLAVLDGASRVLAANDAFYLLLGLSADRTVGKPLMELGAGEWRSPAVGALLSGAVRDSRVEGVELSLASVTAGHRRLRANVRAVRQGENRVSLLLLSLQPVVEPPRASGGAADELARLAAAHAGDVVALFRRDGTCVHVAGDTEGVLGYLPEEFAVTHPADLLPAPELARLRERIPEAVRSREPLRLVLRVRRRRGPPLWMDTAVRALRDGEGRLLLHVAMRDATERRRAEEALRWLGKQTKLILDTAAEGIFGVDGGGRITFINPAAARLLGQPVEELLGRPCGELFGAAVDDGRPLATAIEKTLRHGIAYTSSDARVRRHGGAPVPVEYSCSPARDRDRVLGAVVTLRDIGERLRTEAALHRAEWLAGVGETVLAIRHEVNNPLTTLLAEASLLEMGGNSPAEERESIAAMIHEARRIGEVLRRLAQRQHDPPVRYEGADRMLDLG